MTHFRIACMHVGLEDEDEEAPQKAEQQRKRARNTSQQGNAGKRKASKLASSPADEDDADGDMHAAEGNDCLLYTSPSPRD